MNRGWLLILLLGFAPPTSCGKEGSGSHSVSDTDPATTTDSNDDTQNESDSDSENADTAFDLSADVNKLAVLIGISDYWGTGSDLVIAHRDPYYWHRYLTTQGYQTKTLGDGRPEKYIEYHGDATDANIDKFIRYAMNSADSNDMVAITFAGHGGILAGESYYAAWDMSGYTGKELAAALNGNDEVGQVFLFMACCNSGGFGPDVLATTNGERIWFAANATADGQGWQIDTLPDLAWTYFFLNMGLMLEFDGENVSMEETFGFAEPLYRDAVKEVMTLPEDLPEEFDGQPKEPFYLNVPDRPSNPSINAHMPLAPLTAATDETLQAFLSDATEIAIRHTDWKRGMEHRTVREGTVLDHETLRRVWASLNTAQPIRYASPTCLFSHTLDFKDATKRIIGRIGICESPKEKPPHHAVLVTFDEHLNTVSRRGIVLANPTALMKTIERRAVRRTR